MRSLLHDTEIRATLWVFGLVSLFILSTFFTDAFPWLVFWPTFLVASFFIFQNSRVGLFAIILLTMIWEQFFTLNALIVSGRVVKLYPLDILLLVTFLSFLAHWILERRHRKVMHHPSAEAPSFLLTFGVFEKALLLFAALSTVYFFESQLASLREPAIAFSTFKNYAFYMLLTFLVLGLIRTPEHLRRCMQVMLAGGVGILAFLAVGIIRGEGLWTQFTPLSTEGVRYLAFPHAYYLTLVLLIGLNLFLYRRFPHSRIVGIIFTLQFLGIVGSLMRHLWIALVVGIVVLLFAAPRETRRQFFSWIQIPLVVVLLVAVVLVASALFFPGSGIGTLAADALDPFIARVASFGKVTEDISALWRLKFWQATLGTYLSSPILGIGFGREVTFDVRGFVSTIRLRDLHNSHFGVLVQTGLLGFALFVLVNVSLLVGYLKRRKEARALRPWADGVLAALVAFLVAANFQPYLETNILGVFFWLLLGLLRVVPFLVEERLFDWRYLRRKQHLQWIESVHHRGKIY